MKDSFSSNSSGSISLPELFENTYDLDGKTLTIYHDSTKTKITHQYKYDNFGNLLSYHAYDTGYWIEHQYDNGRHLGYKSSDGSYLTCYYDERGIMNKFENNLGIFETDKNRQWYMSLDKIDGQRYTSEHE